MGTLQVISQDNNIPKPGLQGRIGLSNRPHLKIGMDRLDEICSVLAKSKGDRTQFVADPTAYLQGQALPVSSCNFTRTVVYHGAPQTTEVCVVNTCIDSLVDCVLDCHVNLFFRTLLIGVDVPDSISASDDFDFKSESTIAGLNQRSTLL